MPARKTHRGRSKAARAKKPADPGPQGPSEQTPIEDRPEEWDFRSIREGQLEAAIVYEYARSAPWVVQVFENWHRRRLRLPKKFEKWSKLTIRKILEKMYLEDVPDEVGGAVEQSKPEEFDTRGLEVVYRIGHLFPKPFSSLDVVCPDEDLVPRDPPAFELRPYRPSRQVTVPFPLTQMDDTEENFLRWFGFCINLRVHKDTIKRQMCEWIDHMWDRFVERLDEKARQTIKQDTGKRETPPWHELRELTAYRLTKGGGLTYAAARSFVEEYRIRWGIKDPNGVLPNYAPSGFSGAVKDVENRIKALYPEP